jgi:hypothetical protein
MSQNDRKNARLTSRLPSIYGITMTSHVIIEASLKPRNLQSSVCSLRINRLAFARATFDAMDGNNKRVEV